MSILSDVYRGKSRIEVASDQEKYVVTYYLRGVYNCKDVMSNFPYSAFPFIGISNGEILGWDGCDSTKCVPFRDFLKEILDCDLYFSNPKVDVLL